MKIEAGKEYILNDGTVCVASLENVKQVYLDEETGRHYDTIKELEKAREIEIVRVEFQSILDTNCDYHNGCDLDDVINDIKRSTHRDDIIKFLTENT